MPAPDLTMTSKVASPNETLDLFGHQIQHLTALSDADGGYCLVGSNFPAGAVVPIHSHAERETFYILAGEPQALWEDHWSTLVTGDVLDVPGGIKHVAKRIGRARVIAGRDDHANGPVPPRYQPSGSDSSAGCAKAGGTPALLRDRACLWLLDRQPGGQRRRWHIVWLMRVRLSPRTRAH
jgi:uncharacterized RmlC-like cupin family protein